jgi:hypothetical protein
MTRLGYGTGLRVDAAVHSDAPGSMLRALTYHHDGCSVALVQALVEAGR